MPRIVWWIMGSLDQEIRWNALIRDIGGTTKTFKATTETSLGDEGHVRMQDVWDFLNAMRGLLLEIESLTEG